jgi:ligand-binding SRPBCC domain-containing protein
MARRGYSQIGLPAIDMQMHKLVREQWVPQPLEDAFAFFSRPENLQAITPDWLDFRIESISGELAKGTLIRYKLRWHGLPIGWTSEIVAWQPPHYFIDNQVSGPYALWHHEHRLTAQDGGTLIRDEVSYALPLGPAGRLINRLFVHRDVEGIFDYREQRMRELLG